MVNARGLDRGPAATAVALDPGAADMLDRLATMVALVTREGICCHVNTQLEHVIGTSRRALVHSAVRDWFVDPAPIEQSLRAVAENAVATSRLDAGLKPQPTMQRTSPLAVHAIVSQSDLPGALLVLELIEIEQQARQEREERLHGLTQANKEVLRNLAHEIKNPLGGIRGAAQLLELDLASRELREYTRVIIHEADRLQALVDRLLAPHRFAPRIDDVNIHEVCERVRSVLLAEHPKGLAIVRDYDASLPEFRGDREQLIQAVLNVAQNAAQALHERIDAGDAVITLRTRVARQVTIGRERYRLALQLHVQDNGPGVPDHLHDILFQPLVSGRDGGSGLGLMLAQAAIGQHHGTIGFASRPGRTAFEILIPLP